jgi:uncharacterized protein (TIGR03435 family)
MHKLSVVVASRRKLFVRAVAFVSTAALVCIGLATATRVWAHAQGQSPAGEAPKFEYEVASFKAIKPGNAGGPIRIGIGYPPDGFNGSNITIQMLITQAYGIQPYQLSGGPDWLNSERFDVDAKMDPATADALSKLTPDDRNETRRRMMQALLADRLKLTVRRDTKELPVYNLVIGKNGSKLKETKPDDTATAPPPGGAPGAPGANAPRDSTSVSVAGGGGGRGGPGTVMFGGRGGEQSINANGVPIATLIRMLGTPLGRPVIDKTGLTGRYDIALKWTPDDNQSVSPLGGGPDGGIPAAPSDASGPSLFTAIQEQLGLKLESAKGPVLMIVIEHIEKPSEN